MMMVSAVRLARDGDVLADWAQSLTGQTAGRSRGRLRFAFYGRVSTEDWQDPVTSRARQRAGQGAGPRPRADRG